MSLVCRGLDGNMPATVALIRQLRRQAYYHSKLRIKSVLSLPPELSYDGRNEIDLTISRLVLVAPLSCTSGGFDDVGISIQHSGISINVDTSVAWILLLFRL